MRPGQQQQSALYSITGKYDIRDVVMNATSGAIGLLVILLFDIDKGSLKSVFNSHC